MHARAGYPLSALAMLCLLFGGVECASVDTPTPIAIDPPASLAGSPKRDTANAIGDTALLVAAARHRNGPVQHGAADGVERLVLGAHRQRGRRVDRDGG